MDQLRSRWINIQEIRLKGIKSRSSIDSSDQQTGPQSSPGNVKTKNLVSHHIHKPSTMIWSWTSPQWITNLYFLYNAVFNFSHHSSSGQICTSSVGTDRNFGYISYHFKYEYFGMQIKEICLYLNFARNIGKRMANQSLFWTKRLMKFALSRQKGVTNIYEENIQ